MLDSRRFQEEFEKEAAQPLLVVAPPPAAASSPVEPAAFLNETAHSTPRSFLRTVVDLAKPYWTSDQRWRAGARLAGVVSLNLSQIGITVLDNEVMNEIGTALQSMDKQAFMLAMLKFGTLLIAGPVAAYGTSLMTNKLDLEWRRWETKRILPDLECDLLDEDDKPLENPDQRVTESMNNFIESTVGYPLGAINTAVSVTSFSVILWNLSSCFNNQVLGVSAPGFLSYGALAYSGLCTWGTVKLGKKLPGLMKAQQKLDGDFRAAVRDVSSDNCTNHWTSTGLCSVFDTLIDNKFNIARNNSQLLGYGQATQRVNSILPYMICLPVYMAGHTMLGPMLRIADAVTKIHASSLWITNIFSGIAQWQASAERYDQACTAITNAHSSPRARQLELDI